MNESKNPARERELDKTTALYNAATDYAAYVNSEKHDYDEGMKLSDALEAAAVSYAEIAGDRQPEPSKTGETKHVCISDLLERRFVIQTVMEEEELEGPMPDSIWNMLSTREGATEVLRANVRAIKFNIVKRLRSNS